METRDQVLDILQRVTKTAEVKQDGDLRLFDLGLIDSMQTVELMVALSDAFAIDISPAEFEPTAWATPDLLVEDILQRVAAPR